METRHQYRAWLIGYKKMVEVIGLYANGLIEVLLSEDDMDYSEFSGDEYILMQCTGLEDKNDTLIFEGDILQDTIGYGEVKWLMEDCRFVVRTIKPEHKYYNLVSDGQLKTTGLVGNIHENPELMEGD